MKILFLSFRFPLIIGHILVGLIILIFFPKTASKLKPIHHAISLYWMKILVFLFGLKIILKGQISKESNAFVSNHISFLDIIVLNSLIPSNFIAKSEIKNWPVIGHLSSKTGTIFIKRGDTNDINHVVGVMKDYINKNKKIIFFPEGRIGNGVNIKKFHSKLFNCISGSNSIVQPIFIRYPLDYPNNIKSDDTVCWADKTQTLIKISLRCLGRSSTNVMVHFEKPISTTNLDSYELAKKSANSVLESINRI
ncbi:1-acyl-sn-glycerol-3-phosphate acyltransferase [Gammaproteobacteria bacterium]|nr:1-acyl-sn-glycerol-3-phosphate acyltransferase [Gammaproteobacteria bacterium]